jgi:uncharacterized protein with PIN domain
MAFSVSIRFYEELNDFIPKRYRGTTIKHPLSFRTSIRDIVESFGVPHTEVDLVLVNGQSVGFEYRIGADDLISVYPVFESLNIAAVTKLRSAPLRATKFILDVHLGKLARHLRMHGFDTAYRNDYSDPEIITLAKEEQRIILTRDVGLLKNGQVTHGYFVRSQVPRRQIQEVLRRFDLWDQVNPLSRCMVCNGKIMAVEKEKVRHLLKPKTRTFYHEFFMCRGCGKIYWEGSHFKKMMENFTEQGRINPQQIL